VDSLTLGSQTYNKTELVRLLRKAPKGDASIILAKQLIAAKLNILSGANADDIGSVIDDADTLLSSYTGKLPYGVRASSPEGQDMIVLAEQLDEYNQDYEGCKIKEEKTCGCKKIYSMTMKFLETTSAL